MSAYAEWKDGMITDAEYASACLAEEFWSNYYEEHPEEFEEEEEEDEEWYDD